MKRTIGVALVVAVSAAFLLLFPTLKHTLPVAHAQGGCSHGSLTGNYALTWSGFTTLQGSRPQVPWAGEGVVAFDGGGNVSTTYSTAINGTAYTNLTSSGTYTVNSDCTASLAFTKGDAAGLTANMVIIGGGTEVVGTTTDAGDTASFDLKRQ
jgi:hypothetical protein